MTYDWNKVKETIQRLYVVEGKSLEEVKKELARNRAFAGSKFPGDRIFRSKIKEWGFTRPPKRPHDAAFNDSLTEPDETSIPTSSGPADRLPDRCQHEFPSHFCTVQKRLEYRYVDVASLSPADVNTPLCGHASGDRLLHLAAWVDMWPRQFEEILNYSISNGLGINAKGSEGRTALHYAVLGKFSAFGNVRALLKRGADPNISDENGDQPLHLAIRIVNDMDGYGLVRLLLDHGADPNVLCTRPGEEKLLPIEIAFECVGKKTRNREYDGLRHVVRESLLPLLKAQTADLMGDTRISKRPSISQQFLDILTGSPDHYCAAVLSPCLEAFLDKGLDPFSPCECPGFFVYNRTCKTLMDFGLNHSRSFHQTYDDGLSGPLFRAVTADVHLLRKTVSAILKPCDGRMAETKPLDNIKALLKTDANWSGVTFEDVVPHIDDEYLKSMSGARLEEFADCMEALSERVTTRSLLEIVPRFIDALPRWFWSEDDQQLTCQEVRLMSIRLAVYKGERTSSLEGGQVSWMHRYFPINANYLEYETSEFTDGIQSHVDLYDRYDVELFTRTAIDVSTKLAFKNVTKRRKGHPLDRAGLATLLQTRRKYKLPKLDMPEKLVLALCGAVSEESSDDDGEARGGHWKKFLEVL